MLGYVGEVTIATRPGKEEAVRCEKLGREKSAQGSTSRSVFRRSAHMAEVSGARRAEELGCEKSQQPAPCSAVCALHNKPP